MSTPLSQQSNNVETLLPKAFRLDKAMTARSWNMARKISRRLTGKDLFPSQENIDAFTHEMFTTDSVAEEFVDQFYSNTPDAREQLKNALDHGIASVPKAHPALVNLFADFDSVPHWVDHAMVEAGAATWRRWGTMLFAIAGGETLEMYTEAAVATPLSLTGGYAGDNALRRFLETCKFWMDTSEPGALFEIGSPGRATAMHVRVMHVAVRRQVSGHPEWDTEEWGEPISQSYQMLTLLGGSVVPALALWLTGIHTTPKEIRELLHFQRFLGHLLGVRNSYYPDSIAESLRLLTLVNAARNYDAGPGGAELIESFPTAFAPRPETTGFINKIRDQYTYRMYSTYPFIFMLPWTWRKFSMPTPIPGLLILIIRLPLVTAIELGRRFIPAIRTKHEQAVLAHRANWYQRQMRGREAEFTAASRLRR